MTTNVANTPPKESPGAAALVNTNDNAKALNQAAGDFITNISHDIRTPLSAILGYAEMIYDSQQTLRDKLACLGKIKRKVSEITELLDDSIEFSRLDAGVIEVHAKEISLLGELSETILSLQSEAKKKRLGFSVTSEGLIPSYIFCDPLLLKELIFNVVDGAINLTKRGGIKLILKLIPSKKDNGIGVLECAIHCTQLMREPHEKGLNSASEPSLNPFPRRSAGTAPSLWLSISQRLARLLGGDVIHTRNPEETLSRFVITICPGPPTKHPALDGVSLHDLDFKMAPNNETLHNKRPGPRVLLVEDDEDLQEVTTHFLKNNGAIPSLATTGTQALEKAAGGSYDLVLMDIEMPGLDGYETTLRLRKNGFKSPIIALTAHTTTQVKDRCMKAGCDDFVLKPLSADNLRRIISQYYEAD